jgi:acyl carrier protein
MVTSYQAIVSQVCEELGAFLESGKGPVTEDTDLIADLGLDSMQVMELVLAVEDRFDISIPLNVLADVRTVRDFARQLEAMLAQRR